MPRSWVGPGPFSGRSWYVFRPRYVVLPDRFGLRSVFVPVPPTVGRITTSRVQVAAFSGTGPASTRATRGAGPESWGARRKSPDPLRIRASSEVVFGGDLLSHTLTSAVPSALAGLASGFGMGPGVSLPLWPP